MSAENKIVRITLDKFIRMFSDLYSTVIEDGWALADVEPAMLWGHPGAGKTSAIRQIRDSIEARTGKKVNLIILPLAERSLVDVGGIPAADSKKEFTVWLKPKIFDLDPSEDVINLLFLDELSTVNREVQKAALSLTLEHRVGEHLLPDNLIVFCAGNGNDDEAATFRLNQPLANRMQHYEVSVEYDVWKKWAQMHDIHPLVLSYLAYASDRLYMEKVPLNQVPFVSPRTWERVSTHIRIMEGKYSLEDMYEFIAGCIGTDDAYAFMTWVRNQKDLPNVEDIFRGKKTAYPKSPDALYALIAGMRSYMRRRTNAVDHSKVMTVAELENMSIYASRFPADYQSLLYHDLERNSALAGLLARVRLYREWKQRNDSEMLMDPERNRF